MEESDDIEKDRTEAERFAEAFLIFTHYFQDYVREMDPELWKRAVDYAKTFTEVEGVEFTYAEPAGCTADED
jgi:hypothetical protein